MFGLGGLGDWFKVWFGVYAWLWLLLVALQRCKARGLRYRLGTHLAKVIGCKSV